MMQTLRPTTAIRVAIIWPLAAAAAGLAALACAGNDGAPEAFADTTEAFSDTECHTATADSISGRWSLTTDFTSTSPYTYGGSGKFATYIWDVKPSSELVNVLPDLFIATGSGGLPTSAYDTQAECTGITFGRRIYVKYGATSSFQIFAEAPGARGYWDSDMGCSLPTHIAPDIPCGLGKFVAGNFVCSSGVTTASTIRVCVSARDMNGATIPVFARISSTTRRLPFVYNNPQVRVSGVWQAIESRSTEATGFCAKFNQDWGGSFTTKPAPAFPYAFYNPAFSLWRVPLTDSTPLPIMQQDVCTYRLSH